MLYHISFVIEKKTFDSYKSQKEVKTEKKFKKRISILKAIEKRFFQIFRIESNSVLISKTYNICWAIIKWYIDKKCDLNINARGKIYLYKNEYETSAYIALEILLKALNSIK